MESSSFSGSSKRAKAPGNIAQVAHCLVDGCNADLSLCRDYHRRHKVCEIHSKTAKVTIGGREQRFCQQCSRFHSLVEFVEGQRSCRKRLDGHNRRRRKPQPDSVTRNSGLDFSNQQGISGTRLVSFSAPQILPSAVVGFSWAGVVKTDENDMGALCNNQPQQLNYVDTPNSFPKCCSAHSYKGSSVNQLQFMQCSDGAMQEASICQPYAAAGSSSCSQKIFSDGLNQVVDSDGGALSLLSSATPVTREFGLNHVLQTERLPQAQSLVNNLQYSSGLGQYELGQESKPVVSSTDSHGSNASTLHFQEMFQHGPQGSSTTGSHQTLTFMWE